MLPCSTQKRHLRLKIRTRNENNDSSILIKVQSPSWILYPLHSTNKNNENILKFERISSWETGATVYQGCGGRGVGVGGWGRFQALVTKSFVSCCFNWTRDEQKQQPVRRRWQLWKGLNRMRHIPYKRRKHGDTHRQGHRHRHMLRRGEGGVERGAQLFCLCIKYL